MRRLITTVALLATMAPSAAPAYKVQISDEATLNLDVLLQVHGQSVEKAAPDATSWSTELFLRRVRLMLFGDLSKRVSFFFDTDQANLGKNGDWGAPFFVQDAFMTIKGVEALNLDAGMILLPFTRHSMSGSIGLNGLDYHTALIKYPDGSTKIWRDVGVQLRGNLLDKKLHYRVGAFTGSQSVVLQADADKNPVVRSNPTDLPRATGHVRYAVVGTDADFFFKGIYFADAPVVSFGVGADFVPDSVLRRAAVLDDDGAVLTPGRVGDHLAVAGDVFVDYPINSDNELVLQAAVLFYGDGNKVRSSGLGVMSEVGYRWRDLEPVLALDYFKGKVEGNDLVIVRGGLNWWLSKHATNVKLDVALDKRGDLSTAQYVKSVTAQTQLFF